MGASALSRISAIDDAVPARVIGALRTQIIEAQARPRTGDGTHWYSLDAPPRRLFEQVIQHLRGFVPRAHEFIGAEWWFRATTTDTGCPFHFDRDEAIRSSIVSPGLASILYLSNAGGPTVILDATPSRSAAPTAGIAVHPRPGRFGMFPGTLLHGVLPGRTGRWPRVTMLVNWWRSVPRLERARELDRVSGSRFDSLPEQRRWTDRDPGRDTVASIGAECGDRGAPAAWSVRHVPGRAPPRGLACTTGPMAARHDARQLVAVGAADGMRARRR